jgi:hypothetical protein
VPGAATLARVASQAARGWTEASLLERLQCRPLAWLLSDPRLTEKPELLRLLACEPNVSAARARQIHCRTGTPAEWTAFSAGTQGDFASYLLSGLGRLARFLGHRGLVLILDEMEKWQDLNWKAQSQAGNLLGGLIWSATGEEGERDEEHRPHSLYHSRRAGGYPFTTIGRCHVGIAIALTPRGAAGPEQLWSSYGPLRQVELPALTPEVLAAYVRKLAPLYARAHGLSEPDTAEIAREARREWVRIGDGAMRTAVQQVIAALDGWRERAPSA